MGSSSAVIIAKMAKSAVSGDRPGWKTLAILSRQARFTTSDIPFRPMPWVMACCHTGCLPFIEGMNTRMGQKAACGENGGIMDRTKG